MLCILFAQGSGRLAHAAIPGTPFDFPVPAFQQELSIPTPTEGSHSPIAPPIRGRIDNSGNVPQDVVAGDFNDDGIPDLAIAFAFDDAVRWYVGLGDGAFVLGGTANVGVHWGPADDLPRALWAHDFDADGFLDLAVLCSGNPNAPFFTSPSLGVLYGRPAGGFEPFASIDLATSAASSPVFSTSLAAGLLDADSQLDLVVGHFDSQQFSVILHDHGRFWKAPRTHSVTTSGTGPTALAVADLDFDGVADLVVANRRDLQVWSGNGSGGFMHRATFSTGAAFTAVHLADFDRDGAWDLAALDGAADVMRVFTGLTAAGSVLHDWSIPLKPGGGPVDLLIYDADQDGREDVALVYLLGGGGHIFLGRDEAGTAPLAASGPFPTAQAPRALTSADFDMDGMDDLAIVHEGDRDFPANEDLALVSNPFPARIRNRLTPQGFWVPGGQVSPYLNRPCGLAWDAVRAALWTIDRKDRQIVRLSSDGEAFEARPFDQFDQGRFVDPVGIAADHRGDLWIADRLAGRVFHVAPDRLPDSLIGEFPTTPAGVLCPCAIAYDRANGRLLVADERAAQIVAFTTEGIVLDSYTILGGHLLADLEVDASTSTLLAALLDKPNELAVLLLDEEQHTAGVLGPIAGGDIAPVLFDATLSAVAHDSTARRLWVMTGSGALVRAQESTPQNTGKSNPVTTYSVETIHELRLLREICAVDVDAGDHILLCDAGLLGTLVRMNDDGTVLDVLPLNAPTSRPMRVEGMTRRGNRILVLDGLHNEIRAFDQMGRPQGIIPAGALAGRRPWGLYGPIGSGGLLVGTPGRILELAANGSLVAEHAIPASAVPGSISRAANQDEIVVFLPSHASLQFYRADFSLQNVMFQPRRHLPRFQPRAAVARGAMAENFILVGAGEPTVVSSKAAAQGPASVRHWRAYR